MRIFTAITAFFILFAGNAQTGNTPGPGYLGIENGLSNNNVTNIYQDHHGFMWFGTYNGLNRYDGYGFKIFRNSIGDSSSLINDRINCIQEDDQHLLWIGTGKGVSIYNNITFRFNQLRYIPFGQQRTRPINFSVHAVRPGNNHQVYLATKQGLLISRSAAGPAVQVPLLLDNRLTADYQAVVVSCEAGKIWALVRGAGLCLYDETKQHLRIVEESVKENANYLLQDGPDILWIGANDGIYRYHIPTRRFKEKKLSARVVHLSFSRRHEVLIASEGGGVLTIDSTCSRVSPLLPQQHNEALASTGVSTVYEDAAGRRWIATLQGGIRIADLNKQLFTTILRGPGTRNERNADYINAFCEHKPGQIWIGTEGNGISLWHRAGNTYTDLKNPAVPSHLFQSNVVIDMAKDVQGNLWLTGWARGVDKFDTTTHRFTHYPCFNTETGKEDHFVWKVYADSRQQLWASTLNAGGLYLFNRQADRFDLFDNTLQDLLILSEDRTGHLWAGDYSEHLIQIDQATRRHKRFTIGYRVRTIHEDRQGRFWVGTEGGGLLLFNKRTGSYKRFTRSQGLPDNSILSMLEDQAGCLWIGTFNGLGRFDPATQTCKNYSFSDGLQSNQFNYNTALKLSSGELLFGGIKGFNLFDPAVISAGEKKRTPAGLFLTGIRIDNIPIETDPSFISRQHDGVIEEITIPYDKAVVSFDFVALEYSAPDKVSYAYYMEGIDRRWNRIDKSRSASFSQFYEGEYTFTVKATSTDGSWSPQQLSVHLIILPPWYRTWWAWLLYIMTIVTAFYLYFYFQKKRNQLAYAMRLAQLETEKEKELNEKKLSFFTNISHEFRTPLTLIMNPVKELLKESEALANDTRLKTVYRNAKRLLGLVDQLLFFRKAGTAHDTSVVYPVNVSVLCEEVYEFFTQQARSRHIQYGFQCESDDIELYLDREKMEIALFNVVSNAIRFTPDGGRVHISVQEHEQQVTICIADSGPGIDPAVGDRIFEKFYQAGNQGTSQGGGFGIGLYLVKHFASIHHGQVWYSTQAGEGTRFYIRLLKGKTHFTGQVQVLDAAPPGAPASETAFADSLSLYQPQETQPPAAPEQMPKSGVQLSGQKSLLIIDDDEEIRSYIQQLFGKEMHVLTADNGDTGLALCRKYQPDMVISDVVMPGMNGVVLCNHIKQDPDLNHIPVILLTAVSSSDMKLQGLEEGADDYITKPFDKDLLVARVNNILNARSTLQHYYFDKITLKESRQKISAEDKQFLENCIAIVEENLDNEEFTIHVLTTRIGMSRSKLYRKVKAISGSSVNTFIRSIRLRKAAVLLLSTDLNVNQVAFQVGIIDVRYFRTQFRKVFGMNPSDYVKKYRQVFNKEFQIVQLDN